MGQIRKIEGETKGGNRETGREATYVNRIGFDHHFHKADFFGQHHAFDIRILILYFALLVYIVFNGYKFGLEAVGQLLKKDTILEK